MQISCMVRLFIFFEKSTFCSGILANEPTTIHPTKILPLVTKHMYVYIHEYVFAHHPPEKIANST